jgi:hypothetical protein
MKSKNAQYLEYLNSELVARAQVAGVTLFKLRNNQVLNKKKRCPCCMSYDLLEFGSAFEVGSTGKKVGIWQKCVTCGKHFVWCERTGKTR